jgi:hypothetical protein
MLITYTTVDIERHVRHCRKKPETGGANSHVAVTQASGPTSKIQSSVKKKRPPLKAAKQNSVVPVSGLQFLRVFTVIGGMR